MRAWWAAWVGPAELSVGSGCTGGAILWALVELSELFVGLGYTGEAIRWSQSCQQTCLMAHFCTEFAPETFMTGVVFGPSGGMPPSTPPRLCRKARESRSGGGTKPLKSALAVALSSAISPAAARVARGGHSGGARLPLSPDGPGRA